MILEALWFWVLLLEQPNAEKTIEAEIRDKKILMIPRFMKTEKTQPCKLFSKILWIFFSYVYNFKYVIVQEHFR